MDLLTILITGVGSGVAKGILNLWIEEPFSKEISKNFVSIFASKTKDIIAQRKGVRQFDEISEKVAQNLLPIFENAEGISEKRKQEIAELAGTAAKGLKISAELLIQENLDAKQIEKLLLDNAYFPNEENPRINFTEKEEKLYRRVMVESAEYIVSTASKLPKFQENAIAEILKRENSISAIAIETLEEVRRISKHLESSNEQDREFEKRYRNAIIFNLDELILYGVSISKSTKRYKLSVAYVTLLVEFSGFRDNEEELDASLDDMPSHEYDGEQILSIDEAICKSNRLLLRGPAGSGKTTLMKWIAVMSAGYNLNEKLKEWNECVPFFIRLREFSNKDLPNPKDFPSLVSTSLSDEMPQKWVSEKLKTGKAIILVDGIDEIAEKQRKKIKDWIKDIDNNYPDNRWVVTSRPYAAKKGWLGDLGFTDADLQDMNVKNVESFIEHWHNAVRESEPESKGELDDLERKLKITIRENRSLRKLATNPLLCAIICALHKDRNKQLPSDRIQLYEACIDMFFRRDKEREVNLEDYIEIGDRQKKALLEDLAYWLVKNNESECDLDFADKRFDKKIPALSDMSKDMNGKAVRRYFVERSGILRQPTFQKIDFPHRTFMEYFAAKAIVEESDFGVVVDKASNDQWREVIQLACGIARREEGNDTILKIIELGDKKTNNKKSLYLLAVVCMGMLREVRDDVRLKIQQRLIELTPPKNIEAAKELASAEDMVVPYLKYDKKKKAHELAMSVRTLAIIGGDKALSELSKYCQDSREGVKHAILQGIKYTDEPDIYAKEVTLDYEYLYIDSNMPLEIINSLPNLERIDASYRINNLNSISHLMNLRYLNIGRTDIENLEPLSNLVNLTSFYIYGDNIRDLRPLEELVNLQELRIEGEKINDITPLSKLVNLKELSIDGEKINDINPLSKLVNLKALSIEGEKINDITPLSKLINLKKLHIGNFWGQINIVSLHPLSNLFNLEELTLFGNRIVDLSPLSKLMNLKELQLGGKKLNDLSPLSKLTNLQSLVIGNTWNTNLRVNDLTPLSNLSELTYLEISGTKVKSLIPISKLVKLKEISISGSMQDLSPLSNLENLEILNISGTKVKSLDALSGLVALTELYVSDTKVLDLSPLSTLIKLQKLHVSYTKIKNLDALSELVALTELDVSSTAVSDLSPLSNLTNLLELNISSTEVTDMSPLSNLPNLKRLTISRRQRKYLQTISKSQLKKLRIKKM